MTTDHFKFTLKNIFTLFLFFLFLFRYIISFYFALIWMSSFRCPWLQQRSESSVNRKFDVSGYFFLSLCIGSFWRIDKILSEYFFFEYIYLKKLLIIYEYPQKKQPTAYIKFNFKCVFNKKKCVTSYNFDCFFKWMINTHSCQVDETSSSLVSMSILGKTILSRRKNLRKQNYRQSYQYGVFFFN